MLRSVSLASAAALLVLSVSSAFAADTLSQESPNQWRASKLAGVSIYGPNNQNVGKISDVLMNRDGQAQYVVIGVGGFLGIGEKDVAIPFDQVKFTDQPLTPPPNPAPNNNLAAAPTNVMASTASGTATTPIGGMAPNGGVAPATTVGLGSPGDTLGTPSAPNAGGAAMVRSTAYPDHGNINMTADQLKAVPTFHFAK